MGVGVGVGVGGGQTGRKTAPSVPLAPTLGWEDGAAMALVGSNGCDDWWWQKER